MLKHDNIHKGLNTYAVTGKRFRLRHQWDEPNRDPGLIQVAYPAKQWKRRVFNGLAQVISTNTEEAHFSSYVISNDNSRWFFYYYAYSY